MPCIHIKVTNGWNPHPMFEMTYYGLSGYREALVKFEEEVDKRHCVEMWSDAE